MVGVGRTEAEEHEALALRVVQQAAVASGTGSVEWPSGTAALVPTNALGRRRHEVARISGSGMRPAPGGCGEATGASDEGLPGLKRCCRRCSFRYMQPKKGGGRPWKGAPGANSANSAPR